MKDQKNDSEKRDNSTNIQINHHRTRTVAQNMVIGVFVFVIALSTVALFVRYHPLLLRRMGASIDLEKHQYAEYLQSTAMRIARQVIDFMLPSKAMQMEIQQQRLDFMLHSKAMQMEIQQQRLDLEKQQYLQNWKCMGMVPSRQGLDFLLQPTAMQIVMAIIRPGLGLTAVPYGSPEDNIPNDDDNVGNSDTYAKVLYQSHQDNIPNVTGRPQVVEDSNDNESPSCGVEVVTCVNNQTYVKLPYPSNGSSIDNGVRGDTSISNRDEDNSNQDDGSFNPLSREDMSCPGAVGGDLDGNDQTTSDTASLFNNETDVQNFNPLNYQPSSEHNVQQDRMVLGPRSFPVQNPDPNLPLPLPHYHGGYSDEDDSGFQN